MSETTDAIPWQYTDSGGVLQWAWVTEHFIARIVGHEASASDVDGQRVMRNYRWELSDLIQRNQDLPRLLVEGASRTWEEAEEHVRDTWGRPTTRDWATDAFVVKRLSPSTWLAGSASTCRPSSERNATSRFWSQAVESG